MVDPVALRARRKVQKLDFQSEFSMSNIIQIFLIFFSLENDRLGAHDYAHYITTNPPPRF